MVQINDRIRSILQPLSHEEKAQLEENILANGCRDPLVLWNGTLIDGHNRYEICTKHGLPYNTVEIQLPDEEAVIAWVEDNQIGRRNLTPDWFRYLLGRKYARVKKTKSEAGAKGGASKDQFVPCLTESTAEKLANEYGVSQMTVKRAEKFAEEVDSDDELRQALWDRENVSRVIKKRRDEEIERQKERILSGETIKPDGLFDVVVIDPPWNYGREYDPETSRIANPYPEMTQTELMELEPPFSDDCVLFLWTTHRFIWDAKALMDYWGFAYKATVVWDKEKIGMGSWFRMQCEFCLVGIKGKPFWNNTTHRDIIREPRREHSRKPDAFYTMVEQITAGRRLDYFAREQREGWEVFGNDTNKF